MLVNRVGDIGLVLAMFMILRDFGSLEFSIINNLLAAMAPAGCRIGSESSNIICFLLFVGAIGKSAQLGLHT